MRRRGADALELPPRCLRSFSVTLLDAGTRVKRGEGASGDTSAACCAPAAAAATAPGRCLLLINPVLLCPASCAHFAGLLQPRHVARSPPVVSPGRVPPSRLLPASSTRSQQPPHRQQRAAMPQNVAAVLAEAFGRKGAAALPYSPQFKSLLQQHLKELTQASARPAGRVPAPPARRRHRRSPPVPAACSLPQDLPSLHIKTRDYTHIDGRRAAACCVRALRQPLLPLAWLPARPPANRLGSSLPLARPSPAAGRCTCCWRRGRCRCGIRESSTTSRWPSGCRSSTLWRRPWRMWCLPQVERVCIVLA